MSKKDKQKKFKIFSTKQKDSSLQNFSQEKSDFEQETKFSSAEFSQSEELSESENFINSKNSEYLENSGNQNDSKEILKQKYLNLLIKYGILFGIFVLMSAFLVLFTLLGKRNNKKELLRTVNETLEIYCENNNVEVIKAIQWENQKIPSHTNYVIFEIDRQSSRTFSYVFMIRTATIYGPESCVYLYEPKNNNVVFAGIADLFGKSKTYIEKSIKPSQISYWAQRIPSIYEYFFSEANNETE